MLRAAGFLVVSIGVLAGCARPSDPDGRYAMLLVIDGVRTDELTSPEVSPLAGVSGECYAGGLWDTYGRDGVAVRAAINPGVTITAPAHAMLLTGRIEPFGNFPVGEDGAGWYLQEHPGLVQELRGQLGLPEREARVLANSSLIEPVAGSLQPNGDAPASWKLVSGNTPDMAANEDGPVLEEIQAAIEAGPPRLLVVNLHDSDRAGHYGETVEYAEGVRAVDDVLTELHAWLREEQPAYLEQALVVVTTDHGRHRLYLDEAWRNHGDACAGCREVPLFLMGGGAPAGLVAEGTYTSLDIAPTIAAHLGIDLPWAQGLPLSPLVPDAAGVARAGETDVAVAGDHVAIRRFADAFDARSEVVIDGQVVSTPEVLMAEAPVLAENGDALFACFRELDLDAGAEASPWTARCFRRAESWVEIGFPAEEVASFWRPALVPWGEGVLAAWAHNPQSVVDVGPTSDVGLHVATWDRTDGWSPVRVLGRPFPIDAAAVAVGDAAVFALGTNYPGDEGRFTRHIEVARLDDGGLAATAALSLDTLLGAGARAERAALGVSGDVVRVAFLGVGDAGRVVAVAESLDGGLTWSEPAALPAVGGDPLPWITPAWEGDAVVWAALVDGESVVCRATFGATEAECGGTGSPRVDALSLAPGGVAVSRDAGVGQWETAILSW